MKFILFAFLITFISCHDANRIPCDNFKTGKFRYKSKYSNVTYLIERNDSSQTEIMQNGNKGDYIINWTSHCEYTLIYKDQLVKIGDSLKIFEPVINVTIIRTAPDYYVFNCKMPNSGSEYDDTIWKAK